MESATRYVKTLTTRFRTLQRAASVLLRDIGLDTKGRRLEWCALAVIWIFYSTNIVFWEASNRRLVAYDQVGHFFDSVAIAKIIGSPLLLLSLPQFLTELATKHPMYFTFTIYPPFVYTVTALLYFLLPPSLPLASSSSIIFLLVLILSVYGLTNNLLGKRVGLFAAFLVGAYPILVGLTRVYYLDFPLTAMVSLTLYLLVKTRHFEDRKTVLLLSLALIAGMLTKQTFPLYVCGPLAYVVFRSLRKKSAVKNVVLCALISSVSVAYYFFIKPGGFGVYFTVYGAQPLLRGDIYYPNALLITLETLVGYMGIPLFMLFSAGIIELINSAHDRGLVLTGLILPVILLVIVDPFYFYDPRFIAPILPLAAVASAAVFRNFNWHRRLQLVGLIIVMSLVMGQYASITYNSTLFVGVDPRTLAIVGATPESNGMAPPSNQDWRIPQILNDLQADALSQHLSRPSLVVLVISNVFFDQTLFMYYAFMDGININELDSGYYSPAAGINSVCAANYVVTRANVNPSELTSVIAQNVAKVNAFVLKHINNFTLVRNYTLPDGTTASLLRRNQASVCMPNSTASITEGSLISDGFLADTGSVSTFQTFQQWI